MSEELRTIPSMLKALEALNRRVPAAPGEFQRIRRECIEFVEDYVSEGKGTEAEGIEEVMTLLIDAFTHPDGWIRDGQHRGSIHGLA